MFKKSHHLERWLSGTGINYGKLVIGIAGTHKGAGVTHLCILLSQYISEYMGQKTAYVECHPNNDIRGLPDYLKTVKESEEENSFSIHRVTYYKNQPDSRIGEIIGSDYQSVILDIGSDFIRGKKEFERCDKKIVVSSLSYWKRHELERFIQNTNHVKNCGQWIFAIPFVQNKEILLSTKEYHRGFYSIPFEPNPFVLSTASIHLCQRLI